MSKHLFGTIITHHGIAANNRGDTEGHITTLQKILWTGQVHSTVSAEAIRWGIRYYWQRSGYPVNRVWNEFKGDHEWRDPDWTGWTAAEGAPDAAQTFIDDDVLGFMRAEAAAAEGNEAEAGRQEGRRRQVKGSAIKRRGPLEVTRAISLSPFTGDITFNARSGQKVRTSLYGTEVHATRYQYSFALTPEALLDPARALAVVDAIVGLAEVAGNQARFLFDFSPDAIVFRWTDDMAPRILYTFDVNTDGTICVPGLIERIQAGDIDPREVTIGGSLSRSADGQRLKEMGVVVFDGVKSAADAVKRTLKTALGA